MFHTTKTIKIVFFLFFIIMVSGSGIASAASVEPAFKDVSYGSHPRDLLDIYPAKTDKPAPLVIYIHGGGIIWQVSIIGTETGDVLTSKFGL